MAESTPTSGTTAVVMSGGGARGAYQAGVLAGLAEIGLISDDSPLPFGILVGSSAGAINAAGMAAMAARPADGVARLVKAWSEVEAQQVFRTDFRSLGGIGVRWARDLSLGGLTGKVSPKALLDTSPLRGTIDSWIPFDQISQNIESGAVDTLVLTATNLYTSTGIVFVEGAADQTLWQQRRRRIERAEIGVDHVMASSAIPLLFPPIQLEDRWFGDGSIRNTTPLSPAIHLGADRILAIGVREPRPNTELPSTSSKREAPSIAEIAGVLLDAVMLDAIEVDVEHSIRVNESVTRCAQPLPGQPFRWVDVLALHPSEDVAALAGELADRVPRVVRYLMRGLGSEAAITELTSYLLFDPVFCGRLVELGRRDVKANRDELRSFFIGPPQIPKVPFAPG
ncbi:MAG: patatin-like phospholipase family protein [Deltaproteobacteria bacterium]|nr:patatin-like phospholipase family protein [Deltaproteobacteria bacterium]